MERFIKPCTEKFKQSALLLVEQVFSEYENEQEGILTRRLVEEIRSKKYYVPQLELVMTNELDTLLGYAMFSRFHINGKFDDKLLLLAPVAVRTDMQRRHISKELIEHGFEKAVQLGYTAVIVEGNPRNYRSRGFVTSARFKITASRNINLPAPECLMVKELVPDGLKGIQGEVDYSLYECLK